MWIDATVAAGMLFNPKESQVADKVGFAMAPTGVTPKGSSWLWSWSLAIPKSSKQEAAAKQFVQWATSKDYIKLVAKDLGWTSVPPGTRISTYKQPEYQKAARLPALC
jgi:sorbitol/mannitol transport system substrate-binding protein